MPITLSDKTGDDIAGVSASTTIINVSSGESLSGMYFSILSPMRFADKRGSRMSEPPDPNSPDIYERPMFTHGEWTSRREQDGK